MIQYNKADKTPNEKGWIISTEQLTKIAEDVSMYDTVPSLEVIECVLLAAAGEIQLLEHPYHKGEVK